MDFMDCPEEDSRALVFSIILPIYGFPYRFVKQIRFRGVKKSGPMNGPLSFSPIGSWPP